MTQGSTAGCIFCGRSPQTKTHVHRKAWVKGLLASAPPGPFTMHRGRADITGASRPRDWPSDEFDVAPGAACAVCNSGWMDQIDREAERIVEPMVLGHPTTIRSSRDQHALARWITQVAILIDQTQRRQTVPAEIPHKLFADREPAAGMVAWLARGETSWSLEGSLQSLVDRTTLDPVASHEPNACVVTFRIVNLVVVARIPLTDEERAEMSTFDRDEGERFFKQVWPSKYAQVSWPPPFTFRADELKELIRPALSGRKTN